MLDRYDNGYLALGVAHALMWGVGVTGSGLQDGVSVPVAVLGGAMFGLAALLAFGHLAAYHGPEGPGGGSLVGPGGAVDESQEQDRRP